MHGIDDKELKTLLEDLDRGRQAWISGELGTGPNLDIPQDPDMTIFGPWGGTAARGPTLPQKQKETARLFKGGSGQIEVVKVMASGDLVVLVLIERNKAIVDGGLEGPQPWVLRTTQIFRRESEGWIRLHRHADPLIDRRSPAQTLAIARGEDQPNS